MLAKIFASWRFHPLLMENKLAASTEIIISQCDPCCLSYIVEKHRCMLLPLMDDLQILSWTQKPFLMMNEMWKKE